MSARRSSSVSSNESEDNLIDTEVIESEDTDWLVSADKNGAGELEWLRKDLENSCSIFSLKKKSLVRKLEHMSKGNSFNNISVDGKRLGPRLCFLHFLLPTLTSLHHPNKLHQQSLSRT